MAVTPLDMTDAIPLLDVDGSTGRNSGLDIRQGLLASLLSPSPDTPGVGHVRQGVLPRTWNGVGFLDLLSQPQATASRVLTIGAGAAVIERVGQGPYLAWLAIAGDITADAADATNDRIDAVYAQLRDLAIGDAAHGPIIGIVNGTPSPTPIPPVLPSGAIPLSLLDRPAGVDAIDDPQITLTRRGAGVGLAWKTLEGDAIADPGSVPGELRYRWSDGTLPAIWDVWGTDNAWHGLRDIALAQPTQTGVSAGYGPGATPTIGTITVPDPGWAYRVEAFGSFNSYLPLLDNSGAFAAGWLAGIQIDSTTWGTGSIGQAGAASTSTGTADFATESGYCRSGILVGAHTLYLKAMNNTGSRTGGITAGGSYKFIAKIVPEPA